MLSKSLALSFASAAGLTLSTAGCDVLDAHPGELTMNVPKREIHLEATQYVEPLTIPFSLEGCDSVAGAQIRNGGEPALALVPRNLGGGQYEVDVPASYFLTSVSPDVCVVSDRFGVLDVLEVRCADGRAANTTLAVYTNPQWGEFFHANRTTAILDDGDGDAHSLLALSEGILTRETLRDNVVQGISGFLELSYQESISPLFVREGNSAFLYVGCPLPNCGYTSAKDDERNTVYPVSAEYIYPLTFSDDSPSYPASDCDLTETCTGQVLSVPEGVFGMALRDGVLTVASALGTFTMNGNLESPATEVSFLGGTTLAHIGPNGASSHNYLGGTAHSELRTLPDGRSVVVVTGITNANTGALYDIDGHELSSFELPVEVPSDSYDRVVLSLAPDGKHIFLGAQSSRGWLGDTEGHWTELSWSSKSEDFFWIGSSSNVAWLKDSVVLGLDNALARYGFDGKADPLVESELSDCDGLCPNPRIWELRTVGDSIVVQTKTGVRLYNDTGELTGGVDPLPCGLRISAPLQVVGDTVAVGAEEMIFQVAVK